MRTNFSSNTAILLVSLILLASASSVTARSVHDATVIDLLPQGDFADQSQWALSAKDIFTQQNAEYTEVMVADDKLTIVNDRPLNLGEHTVWASTTSTDSNASIGNPDGAYSWSKGPVISVDGFDISAIEDLDYYGAKLLLHIQIPDALYQDSVRVSIEWGGTYELVKNWAHTTGAINYINSNAYEIDLDQYNNWNFSELGDIEVTLDYVSEGTTDDSQLNVDAVGLKLTAKTQWYGNEVSKAITTFSDLGLPIIEQNLSTGTSSSLSLTPCGLEASNGTTGTWESEPIETPYNQRIGRVHYQIENNTEDDVVLEYATSEDGIQWSGYSPISKHMLLPDNEFTKLRITTSEECIQRVWVDVNDPSLTLTGRIIGDADGLDLNYSSFIVAIEDNAVISEPISGPMSMSYSIPIGKYLDADTESFELSIAGWFIWNSRGDASTTILEVSNLDVSGGFTIQYDEDPVCSISGNQNLQEDGGGLVLPLITRCTDDRTAPEDLIVSFENSNPGLVDVSLSEGQIRIALVNNQHGVASIVTTVADTAGNTWSENWLITVDEVDDLPQLDEFPAVIPVEHDVQSVIQFSYSDVDSLELTASTSRSWATVNIELREITIIPPTPGYQSFDLTICDDSNCVSRTVDLEVLALPDLFIESIEVENEKPLEGDIVEVSVFVRNSGQAEAGFVSVRIQDDNSVLHIGEIAVISPGGLGVVSFDWQVPDSDNLVTLTAIVDRSSDIDEGDETNNEQRLNVIITPNQDDDSGTEGSSIQISGTASTIATIGIIILLVGLYALFAPAKIKKIE